MLRHDARPKADRAAAAAAISALRFDEPVAVAVALSKPSTFTVTVKRRLCAGPSAETVE
jgi:hypothetical protein